MGSLPPSQGIDTSTFPKEIPSEVWYFGKRYKIAREGTAEILELQGAEDPAPARNGPNSQSVFYNPIQQYNRDLSVLAIRAFGDDLAITRRARHQRRLEQLAKGQQRVKKRKRDHTEGTQEKENSASKDTKNWEVTPATSVGSLAATTNGNEERPSQKARLSENGENHTNAQTQEDPLAVPSLTEPGETGMREADDRSPLGDEETKTGRTPAKPPAFRILDALSATGLRALRYAKEIPMATSIIANDLSHSATASIKRNIEHNNLADKITPTTGDAIEHMHRAASRMSGGPGQYHVIDLDPYGTAAPFLDAAVQAIADGGLLCVTCTDAGVFASLGYLEKTYSQYGGLPLKGAHAHEGGLRLILHAIATCAARYGIAIEPLLSLSIDFYVRVFVRVHRSPAEVKFLASKTMIVYNCDAGCGAWSTQYLARAKEKKAKNGDTFYNFTSALAPSTTTHCEHCGFKMHHAGPMWGGPLHNPYFIQSILDMLPSLDKSTYGTIARLEGMLSIALHETLEDPTISDLRPASPLDRPVPTTNAAARSNHPFFFLPSTLSRVLHCISPSDAAVRGALLGLGYRVTRSHTKAGSIATDAPWSVIWEIMREWVRQKSPIRTNSLSEGVAGWGIMQKDRSRMRVVRAQKQLRVALEKSYLDGLDGLKTEIEAALYRISKAEEGQVDEMEADTSDDGGVGLKNSTMKSGKDTGVRKRTGSHPSMLEIVFDEELGKEPQGKRMVRYQPNPRPDWGPMNKAKSDHQGIINV
ncbi:hypothetical protein N7G274_008560 [Stereocaulon virgatum]|uniref:tRNA (guanine(26)-N(2))-dimethyltransferase n=1 Tax=Stereocaulon virgatum TaxID=373712 RepID=A0ABR3ZYM5_9LECA